MIYATLFLIVGLLAGPVAAAPAPTEAVEANGAPEAIELDEGAPRRELFPLYAVGSKCARRGCSVYHQVSAVGRAGEDPSMSLADKMGVKGPMKTLEMLALNDDLNTVVQSDSMCTRRRAMARAAGLAAGLALTQVNAPAFAAETKNVKMGSDSGQLVFLPDEIKICKGDTVTWVNNKGGPHNVVFDEEAIPSGVSQESISMDGQLGDEGEKFSKKFDVAGSYAYYCEPHRGAGMNGNLIVE